MKKIIVSFILITAILISCSTSKKTTSPSNSNAAVSQPDKKTEDALSYETAVVINEKNERDGVTAEYKWIKNNYTDYSIKGQSLITYQKKPYDIITIVLSDGKELKLYFDISNFFGKF